MPSRPAAHVFQAPLVFQDNASVDFSRRKFEKLISQHKDDSDDELLIIPDDDDDDVDEPSEDDADSESEDSNIAHDYPEV